MGGWSGLLDPLTALCRVKTYEDARWSSWFVKWLLQQYVVSQCWCISLHYNSYAFSGSPPLFYRRPVSQFALSICRVESVELWLLITEIFQLHVSMPAFMPGFLVLWVFFRENVGSLLWLPRRPRKSLCERSDETTPRRRRSSCEGLCQRSE